MKSQIPPKRMKHSDLWDDFLKIPKGVGFPLKNQQEYAAIRLRCYKAKIKIKMRTIPEKGMTLFKE